MKAKQRPVHIRWTRKANRGWPEIIGDWLGLRCVVVIRNANKMTHGAEIRKYLAKFGVPVSWMVDSGNDLMFQTNRRQYKWACYLLQTAGYDRKPHYR